MGNLGALVGAGGTGSAELNEGFASLWQETEMLEEPHCLGQCSAIPDLELVVDAIGQ